MADCRFCQLGILYLIIVYLLHVISYVVKVHHLRYLTVEVDEKIKRASPRPFDLKIAQLSI